jgi:hypothetical protein
MPGTGISVGRTNEITTVSRIKPGLTLPLRALLAASAGRLLHGVLANVETIHYASWLIVPMNGRDYLVFISNYTGSFEKYIDDFGSVLTLALGLEVIWANCEDWPGIDSIDDLKAFIRQTTTPAALYYSAYPEATVRDVLKGLRATAVVQELFELA